MKRSIFIKLLTGASLGVLTVIAALLGIVAIFSLASLLPWHPDQRFVLWGVFGFITAILGLAVFYLVKSSRTPHPASRTNYRLPWWVLFWFIAVAGAVIILVANQQVHGSL